MVATPACPAAARDVAAGMVRERGWGPGRVGVGSSLVLVVACRRRRAAARHRAVRASRVTSGAATSRAAVRSAQPCVGSTWRGPPERQGAPSRRTVAARRQGVPAAQSKIGNIYPSPPPCCCGRGVDEGRRRAWPHASAAAPRPCLRRPLDGDPAALFTVPRAWRGSPRRREQRAVSGLRLLAPSTRGSVPTPLACGNKGRRRGPTCQSCRCRPGPDAGDKPELLSTNHRTRRPAATPSRRPPADSVPSFGPARQPDTACLYAWDTDTWDRSHLSPQASAHHARGGRSRWSCVTREEAKGVSRGPPPPTRLTLAASSRLTAPRRRRHPMTTGETNQAPSHPVQINPVRLSPCTSPSTQF